MEVVEVVGQHGERLLLIACRRKEVGVICGWVGTADDPDGTAAVNAVYDSHICIKYRGRLSSLGA
jgi:hypothetical protein